MLHAPPSPSRTLQGTVGQVPGRPTSPKLEIVDVLWNLLAVEPCVNLILNLVIVWSEVIMKDKAILVLDFTLHVVSDITRAANVIPNSELRDASMKAIRWRKAPSEALLVLAEDQ